MRKVVITLILIGIICFGIFSFMKKDEGKIEEPKVADSELISNNIYEEPHNPTEYEVQLYNKLSSAISDESGSTTIANLVAKNFTAEFFTLKNQSTDHINGANFIVANNKDKFTQFAKAFILPNMRTIEHQKGESNLPEVEKVTVMDSKKRRVDNIDNAYEIRVSIKYNRDDENLKKEATIILVKNNEGIYVYEIK